MTPHIHRWICGPASNSVCHGRCACGAERDFVNQWDALDATIRSDTPSDVLMGRIRSQYRGEGIDMPRGSRW